MSEQNVQKGRGQRGRGVNSGDKGVGKKKRKKKMRERMARQEKVARAIALPFYDRLSVRCGLPFPYLSIFLPVHFGGGCRFVVVAVAFFCLSLPERRRVQSLAFCRPRGLGARNGLSLTLSLPRSLPVFSNTAEQNVRK